MDKLLADLDARGLIHDMTDREALETRLAEGPITVYAGFDPTADSLHVGNLVPLLLLRRFQDAGHRPIALAGGATGMVGDPGGRSEERTMLDEATLATNLAAIKPQLEQVLGTGALFVDNYEWTKDVRLLDFLRDVGKFATVNQMVAKDSVRSRMDGTSGISFTEFSYMLLQAHDYLHLHEVHGCEMQVGGSDQWGNITAGVDLVRRRTGHQVHALTVPLITRADGEKFGKSVEGAIWLSAEKTSPYRFFQYWMQVDDADVERFLLQLTLLPVEEASAVAAAHAEAPERREGQRRLAHELTALVHGEEAAKAAEAASQVLFGGSVDELGPAEFEALREEVPSSTVELESLRIGLDLVDALVTHGVVSSKGEARRLLEQHGLRVNDDVAERDRQLTVEDLRGERFVLLRRGKRQYHLLEVVT